MRSARLPLGVEHPADRVDRAAEVRSLATAAAAGGLQDLADDRQGKEWRILAACPPEAVIMITPLIKKAR